MTFNWITADRDIVVWTLIVRTHDDWTYGPRLLSDQYGKCVLIAATKLQHRFICVRSVGDYFGLSTIVSQASFAFARQRMEAIYGF